MPLINMKLVLYVAIHIAKYAIIIDNFNLVGTVRIRRID